MFYLIKTGSVTNAQRAVNILKQYKIKASVIRLQQPKKEEGCGYAVKVFTVDSSGLIALLEQNGIRILGAETV